MGINVNYNVAYDTKLIKEKCKLYVPKDCAKTYKSDKYWKDFTNIIELE